MKSKEIAQQVRGNNEWDLILTPKTSLFYIPIGEIWKYRDLIWLFVQRDFVAQFKQTILGPIWHVIHPILTTVMFLLVFTRIARIPTDGIHPVLFYMSGITMWNYFSACLTHTSNTFVSNAGIFGKVYFPRMVLPISVVISNLIRFFIQFLLLFVVMSWFHFHNHPLVITANWLFIPFLLILMAGSGLGLGIIISSITTKYRDFAVLLAFLVQLGMYITPVAYPLSFLKNQGYEWIIQINPLTPIMEVYRYILFGKGTFDISNLLYSIIFMLTVLVFGSMIFHKVEKSFMDTV